MEALNRSLFLWLNAGDHPPQLLIDLATFVAQWLVGGLGVLLLALWLWGGSDEQGGSVGSGADGGTGHGVQPGDRAVLHASAPVHDPAGAHLPGARTRDVLPQ